MNEKLKIGIMLDSYIIPAWKYKIIEEITLSDFATLSLAITNVNRNSSAIRKGNSGHGVYRLHKRIDRLIFRKSDDYSNSKDVKPFIQNVPEIQAYTIANGNFEEFCDECIDEIRRYDLDVILKFGFGFLKGQILKIPEYGVWSYTMDNYGTDSDGTAGYFEMVMKNPITRSELVILNEDGKKDQIIASADESTCAYSVSLNRDKLFRRASLFTVRVLRGIYQYDSRYLEGLKNKHKNEIRCKNVRMTAPSLNGSVRNFGAAISIILQKIFKKIFYSDPFSWILLFKIDDKNNFLEDSYGHFKKLQPSTDKFWADPFVISREGRYYIFVEEFIYRKNKGHISVLELDKKGKLLNVQKLIEKPYHMSYPFIFETGGEYYMIPETGGNRTIDLYRCIDFPGNWIFVKSIMRDVNAVDTTLFYYGGKWWLFTVIDEINSSLGGSPELFLFFSDDFLSDNWESHLCNPVVSDIRTARPAGKVFINDGKIYRPSQDCSGRYGQALNINQVLVLTENEYKEVSVRKVEPDWDERLKGTHTFNFDDSFTVIDVYSYRRRPFLY